MDADEFNNATVAWYRRRLEEHGPGIRALSSGTEERRALRFDVLTGVGIESGCSVLDVGCGFADYYAYLQERGIRAAYTGVDLVPEFVERARAAHPGIEVSTRDLLAEPPEANCFDFVVCSQTFNLRVGDTPNLPLVQRMIRLMFATARRGVAVDFVSSHVDFREDYLQYHDPEAMFTFCKSLTRRVTLRHDYPLFEFCMYLYPDFRPWGRRT